MVQFVVVVEEVLVVAAVGTNATFGAVVDEDGDFVAAAPFLAVALRPAPWLPVRQPVQYLWPVQIWKWLAVCHER